VTSSRSRPTSCGTPPRACTGSPPRCARGAATSPNLSRLDSATVELAPRRIRLRHQLEEIVSAVTGPTGVEVSVDVPADLEVMVDPSAIERVVGNLVANALNHGAPPVRLTAEHRDRHLRIAVEDRGAGVADEFVPHLFERFQRSDQARAAASTGTGLGLAIARAYARAHGGDLVYTPSAAGARST
jgi:two-component system sensor histidine kinase MtrB